MKEGKAPPERGHKAMEQQLLSSRRRKGNRRGFFVSEKGERKKRGSIATQKERE